MKELPKEVFNRWFHLQEEDKGGIKTYHPITYSFPPARGRRGFEIKKDGIFLLIDIGPADRPLEIVGKWTLINENHITIEFQDKKIKPLAMKFLHFSKDKLLISVI